MQQIRLAGFRGVRSGALEGLAPLNLLLGPNSSGKSTLLEALLLAQGAGAGWDRFVTALRQVANRRGWAGLSSVRALSPAGKASIDFVPSGSAELHVRLQHDGASAQLKVGGVLPHTELVEISQTTAVSEPDPLIEPGTAVPHPELLEDSFSAMELGRRGDELVALLRPLLPSIRDLRILKPYDRFLLHIVDATGPWPAIAAGDGLKRLLLLAGRFARLPEGSLALLEEPEVHLHPRGVAQLATLLWSAVGRGLQIVAATHSLELLDAILEAADEREETLQKLAVFRLALQDGQLKVVRIPGPKVLEMRREIAEDLRR